MGALKTITKVALVTGSSKNIGRAIALELSAAGWAVVINSRAPSSESDEIVQKIRTQGNEALYVAGDVTDEAQVANLFSCVVQKYGTLDLLVNNVGGGVKKPTSTLDKQDFQDALALNFLSAVLCSLQAVRSMEKKGAGKIVNVASVRGVGHAGHPNLIPYCAAKSALLGFTRTFAKAVGPKILVNAVAPGFVDCGGEASIARPVNSAPLIQRLITPLDIAQAVLYFANSEVSTGQIMVIDGGMSLT